MSDAISKAVSLLRGEQGKLDAQKRAIDVEWAKLQRGIDALLGTESPTAEPAKAVTPRIVSAAEPGAISVKTAVKALLDQENRSWTSREAQAALRDSGHRFEAKSLGNAVRTALWQLRVDGDAVDVGDHRTISAKWYTNADGPLFGAIGRSL